MQIKSNQIKSNQIKSNSIILLFLLLAGLCLTSCENFLNGTDVAEEIREAIEIANSNPTTIYIEAPKDSGTLSQTQVKVKRKESFDLKFTPSDNWQFITWEVFDPATDEILHDYIDFNDKTKTEVKVKLLKAADKLIIRPKCVELPKIVSYSPASGVQMANMPIVITFNTPMESPDTSEEETFFDWDYIYLTINGTSVSNYFNLPYFNKEKTVLTIKPKTEEFLAYLSTRNTAYNELSVTFDNNICVTKEGLSIPLVQDKNTKIRVLYKAEIELDPPQKFDFFMSASEITFDNASSLDEDKKFVDGNLRTQGALTQEEYTEKVIQNRTDGAVWLYARYYDGGSGIDSFNVKYRRTNKKDGTKTSVKEESVAENTWYINRDYSDAVIHSDGGYSSIIIQFTIPDLQTDDHGDGAYVFEFSASDVAGNSDIQTRTVIKDSFLDISSTELDNTEALNNMRNSNYNDLIKTIKLADFNRCIYGITTKRIENFYLTYDNETKYEKLDWDENSNTHSITLNLDYLHDQTVILSATDEYGRTATKVFKFPPKPQHVEECNYIYLPSGHDVTNIYFQYSSGNSNVSNTKIYKNAQIIFDTNSDSKERLTVYGTNLLVSEVENSGLADTTTYNSWGILTGHYYDPNFPNPVITNLDYEVDEKNNCYLCMSIDSSAWDYYDYVVVIKNDWNDVPNRILNVFEKNVSTNKFKIDYTMLAEKFWVAGLKGSHICYYNIGSTTGLTESQAKEYSNLPPSRVEVVCISGPGNLSDAQVSELGEPFSILKTDYNQSGSITRCIRINDKYEYSFTDEKRLRDVSYWDFDEGDNLCQYTVSNKNGSVSSTKIINLTYDTFETYKVTMNENFDNVKIEFDSSDDIRYLTVLQLASDGWKKLYLDDFVGTRNENGENYLFSKDVPAPPNTFIRYSSFFRYVSSSEALRLGPDKLFFNGPASSGKKTDSLNAVNGVFYVSSDQPVYIYTAMTKKPYEECKNWDAETWRIRHRKLSETVLPIESGVSTVKFYNPDLSELVSGDCYCTIAHFADGHTEMGEVLVKE